MNLFDANEEDLSETALDEPDKDYQPASHPRATAFWTGHADIERRLLNSFGSEKMPHGLIFAGPKGIGKATMAYRLARFLFKQGAKIDRQAGLFAAPDPEMPNSLDVPSTDPVFSRVAAGGHSDLLTVERAYDETRNKYSDSVDVDAVRKVAPFFRMTAAEGGWRIVIIDDADTMNRNAQNALLKILEEPPANALLILIAHRFGALIPTIRSRAQALRFEPPDEDVFRTLLERHGHRLTREEFAMLVNFTGRSIGRSLDFLKADGLTMAGKVLDLMEAAEKRDWTSIHRFADQLSGGGEGMDIFMGIFQSIYSSLAIAKARATGLSGFSVHKDFLEKKLAKSSLQSLLDASDTLKAHFLKLDTANLDRRQGVLAAFSLIS